MRPPLRLPDVTLCAAASVNVRATVAALNRCLERIEFASCLIFTDVEIGGFHPDPKIERVPIRKLASAQAYSDFLLGDLVHHVGTSHCLTVQWDGFVLDERRWDPAFLTCDYVGAPWPQFRDEHVVGNGGFSLRSRKLLEACKDPDFVASHPEDVAIARINRGMLERKHGLRFADLAVAERFSFERTVPKEPTFGFHGIFNLIDVLGPDAFWETYGSLDDRSTAAIDYWLLMSRLGRGRKAWSRRAKLTLDRWR